MDNFKLLEKHAKHFAGEDKDGKRKAITGIMHSTEGVAYVTDAVKVLRVEGVSVGKEGKTFSLTGKDLEVEPLNVERLLPDRDNVLVEDVLLSDLFAAIDAYQTVAKLADGPVKSTMEVVDNELFLNLAVQDIFYEGNEIKGIWRIGGRVHTPFKKTFNPVLMFECIRVMKDYGQFVHLIGNSSAFTPLLFSAGEVETLLLPIRTY